MKIWRYSACLIATALLAPPAIAQGSNEIELGKIILGQKTPLADKCYDNAVGGEDDLEALEPCNRSLEEENLSRRGRAVVYANRGVINYNVGIYEMAISDFSQSLDLGINFRAKLLTNRGLAYETLGFENLARADYQAALAFREDYKDAKERLEQLELPLYERSLLPKKITAETPRVSAEI